jgi:hypothetical protein
MTHPKGAEIVVIPGARLIRLDPSNTMQVFGRLDLDGLPGCCCYSCVLCRRHVSNITTSIFDIGPARLKKDIERLNNRLKYDAVAERTGVRPAGSIDRIIIEDTHLRNGSTPSGIVEEFDVRILSCLNQLSMEYVVSSSLSLPLRAAHNVGVATSNLHPPLKITAQCNAL